MLDVQYPRWSAWVRGRFPELFSRQDDLLWNQWCSAEPFRKDEYILSQDVRPAFWARALLYCLVGEERYIKYTEDRSATTKASDLFNKVPAEFHYFLKEIVISRCQSLSRLKHKDALQGLRHVFYQQLLFELMVQSDAKEQAQLLESFSLFGLDGNWFETLLLDARIKHSVKQAADQRLRQAIAELPRQSERFSEAVGQYEKTVRLICAREEALPYSGKLLISQVTYLIKLSQQTSALRWWWFEHGMLRHLPELTQEQWVRCVVVDAKGTFSIHDDESLQTAQHLVEHFGHMPEVKKALLGRIARYVARRAKHQARWDADEAVRQQFLARMR